jgi:hypothetical protein
VAETMCYSYMQEENVEVRSLSVTCAALQCPPPLPTHTPGTCMRT